MEFQYVTGFIPSKENPAQLEDFSFTLKDFRKVLKFPTKPTDTNAYEALPYEDQLIKFLDEINYKWEDTKSVSSVKRGRMSSEWSYIFAHFIQCLSAKVGSHDQASKVHVQIVYSAVKNRKIDWPKLIYDDLLSKVSNDHRKQYVLYPRFLTGVLAGSPRFAKDNSFPPGNLTYSAIGSNLLSEKKKSATDVCQRDVIAPTLVVTLTQEPSGMFSFIYKTFTLLFQRLKQ